MITAIVYKSKTGFTKQYAEMLSKNTSVKAYSLDEAKKSLSRQDSVIFMGWLFASKIAGLSKASKLFDVKAVCGVGLSPAGEVVDEQMKKANPEIGSANIPLFYLKGGYEPKKIGFIQNKMVGMIAKSLESKADKTEDDKIMIDMIRNGGSLVSEASLKPLSDYIKSGGTKN